MTFYAPETNLLCSSYSIKREDFSRKVENFNIYYLNICNIKMWVTFNVRDH